MLAWLMNPSEVVSLQVLTPTSLPSGQSGLCVQVRVKHIVGDSSKVLT